MNIEEQGKINRKKADRSWHALENNSFRPQRAVPGNEFISDLSEEKEEDWMGDDARSLHAAASKTSLKGEKERRRGSFDPEWHTARPFNTFGGGFDIELWWTSGDVQNRTTAVMVVVLLVIALLHLVAGIYFVVAHFRTEVDNPYVCNTAFCHKQAFWMNLTLNRSIDPCDNFYEFVCGRYFEREEQGEFFAELVLKSIFKVGLGEESSVAKLMAFYRNDPTFDQHLEFYQACLNTGNEFEYLKTNYWLYVIYV